jgi:hypothetical protein
MITSAATIRAAIEVAHLLVVTSWVQLDDWIDRNRLTTDRGALVRTAQLMELWNISQPTVSRRLAAIRRCGLAEIFRADGHQSGWWVKR